MQSETTITQKGICMASKFAKACEWNRDEDHAICNLQWAQSNGILRGHHSKMHTGYLGKSHVRTHICCTMKKGYTHQTIWAATLNMDASITSRPICSRQLSPRGINWRYHLPPTITKLPRTRRRTVTYSKKLTPADKNSYEIVSIVNDARYIS